MINKSKKVKNVVRIVVIALVGAFLGFQIYLLNAEKLVGDKMPMPFGVGVSVVLSGSMEPELSIDDLIVVKEAESYELRDMVVFESGGDLVVHRIIDIQGEEIITKGDANNVEDEPITLEDIKGKVVFSIPSLGKYIQFCKSPIGIIIIIGAAVFLMEFSFRKEKKKDDDDLERIKEEIRKLQAETKDK